MLIDNLIIKVKAGDGGRGAVAFNGIRMALGPVGGNGGFGGDIYFEGVSDLSALSQFRNKKELKTDDGKNGRGNFIDGNDGEDLIVKIPVGTVVTKLETGEKTEIVKVGEKILIAKGGLPGKGNYHYRSSTNTRPKQFGPGKPGQGFTIKLELKFIADVGLVGLPNSGKSSLLNELTDARSKVGNYAFTTLEPNLGMHYGIIIADIPGLIEGASEGKGLGIKFLQHIERTKIIFHLISAESDNVARDYQIIRNELKKYQPDPEAKSDKTSQTLANKKEYVFLSKSDSIPEKETKKKLAALRELNKNATPLSIHDSDLLEKVKKILRTIQSSK